VDQPSGRRGNITLYLRQSDLIAFIIASNYHKHAVPTSQSIHQQANGRAIIPRNSKPSNYWLHRSQHPAGTPIWRTQDRIPRAEFMGSIVAFEGRIIYKIDNNKGPRGQQRHRLWVLFGQWPQWFAPTTIERATIIWLVLQYEWSLTPDMLFGFDGWMIRCSHGQCDERWWWWSLDGFDEMKNMPWIAFVDENLDDRT